MMRVLHIMADGSPGGGPTVVQTLCEHLANLGVESSILTQVDSYLLHQAALAGVPAFAADFSRRINAHHLGRRIREILRDTRPDILLAHGARSALPASLLRSGHRPPLIHVVHGLHYARKPLVSRVLGRVAEGFCVSRASRTVFVSQADQALARRDHILGRAGHEVIHNGVTVPPGLVRNQAGRKFDIAFIGRLHVQKDPLILPEILLAMRPKRPSMLIVAGGDLDEALRAKIAAAGVGEQITVTGALPRTEALDLLAQARVCVLPSLWEGLPVCLAEAMLLRVAIVASDIPGNQEIVLDESTGLLAPARDACAFAAGINRLLTSPKDWQRLTAVGAAHAGTNFSPIGQATAYRRLFDTVLAETRSRATSAREPL